MLIQNKIKTYTGAKAIIETLKSLGVNTIFGYPGGVVLDLYDELYFDKDIKHILTRHEQAAVHAAEGYARETGKCGVVLVTSGPGATNTVSGIMNAYLDGYPLIILTGQVNAHLLGQDAFQEANICEITKTCTKRTFQITSADDIEDTLKEAFKIANSGKKGPVVIDLVKDIFKQETVAPSNKISAIAERIENHTISTAALEKAILNSTRPLIVAGGGVNHSKAESELYEFATTHKIPVVSTMMGLGSFPQESKNYLGMIGIFGDNSANKALTEADLVISLGARFNDRITNRDVLHGKLFQIDINPQEISRVITPVNSIVGDIKEILSNTKFNKTFYTWLELSQEYRKLNKEEKRTTNLLHSFEVIRKIEDFTKEMDVTFTSEVGQHQLWTVHNLKLNKNRKIFVSGGTGTMGFGLPAAIGASVASPEKTVICITGDGSFQMGLHELATCKDNNLNVKIMILNNGYLGMVRQLQEKQCNRRYSETKISNPDFVTLAKSYGIDAIRVTNSKEIENALHTAFSTDKPFVIDFVVEPMETL